MNVFWQELKFYRRSVAIWIVALGSVATLFMSEYGPVSAQVDSFRQIVSHYPKALLAAINFRFEIFYSIYGFFGYILTFIWLAGSIQAMNLGVSIVSKEVTAKTADFLLSKPTSRAHLLSEKFAAAFCLIVITNVFFTATSLIAAKLLSSTGFSIKLFILLAMSLFFIQLFFLVLGFLFGAVLPKVKSVIAVSLPTVFVFFVISSFGGFLDKPQLYYLTPFKYFDPVYIFQHGNYEYKYLLWLAVFVAVWLIISYTIFTKKDIKQ
ncbi:ABC transporter permease subunit [Candidatus Saccharibacteria bacterium]|nr:ABC transporter permease subunit [Candidatus Saccharibacteria bacterium]